MSGTLLIVGGGLNASQNEVFSALIEKAGGLSRAKIAFIVTASGEEPDDLFRSYRADLVALGLKEEQVSLVPIYAQHVLDERGYNAMTGDAEGLCDSLDGVTGVWFTGGDQYFTHQCLLRADGSDTALLTRLRQIYENGGVIGGSSAGAAIMSRVMIGSGNNRGILTHPVIWEYADYDAQCEKDDPCDPMILARGLGFFPEGIVDQHFNKRPRLLRLIEACMRNTENFRVGYAVSEDTALVYHEGAFTVLGSAGVYVADCRSAVREDAGNYRGVVLHAIHKGDSFDCRTLQATLAQPSPQRDRDFFPDYVSGGVIHSPLFDDMIDRQLLQAKEGVLPANADGLPCICGAEVSDLHGETAVTVVEYARRPDTCGYRGVHTSFANLGLCVRSKKIQL